MTSSTDPKLSTSASSEAESLVMVAEESMLNVDFAMYAEWGSTGGHSVYRRTCAFNRHEIPEFSKGSPL